MPPAPYGADGKPHEKAILAGLIDLQDSDRDAEPLAELRALCDTAGADVVAEFVQHRTGVDSSYYLGRGKIEEVGQAATALGASLVIFDNDLSPGQVRNVERYVSCKVIDRSELIMDIFATRARTKMARLQVELAQLEYELPRLKRMWKHLDRLDGGGIGGRGPGERQLEVDRRLMSRRISDLKHELKHIEARQERQVRSRHGFATVGLVGYTNTGKSTLMKCLTGKDVFIEDKLFATLDTRTALWDMGGPYKALLSDTVGFIRKLPHHLIASFKATLEEARHADLLLHVIDAADPDINRHYDTVVQVLDEMGCGESPRLCVLNKIDKVEDPTGLNILHSRLPDSVEVSARTGQNLDALRDKVVAFIDRQRVDVEVRVPSADGRTLSYLHEHGQVTRTEFDGETTVLLVRLDMRLVPNVERSATVNVIGPALTP